MVLFSRRSRSEAATSESQTGAAAEQERAPSGSSRTSSLEAYPKGAGMRAVVVHVALWSVVVLAALGGVGFIWQIASTPSEVVAAPESVAETDPLDQRVSAFALSYTTAWLSASKDDAGRLGTFVQLQSTNDLSSEPWQYRDPVVDEVGQLEDEIYSVLVLAWVKESVLVEGDSDQSESAWLLRGFRSTIQVTEAGLAPVGFPAPAAVATGPTSVELNYAEQVSPESTAGEAVQDFLSAYVAGEGDISRFLSPDASIDAIVPAPYASVTVRSIYASSPTPDAPEEGESVDVFVDVVFTAADGRSVPATYLLTLSSRAERWEISSLAAAPQIYQGTDAHPQHSVQPSPSSPAPAEEPSDAPTSTP